MPAAAACPRRAVLSMNVGVLGGGDGGFDLRAAAEARASALARAVGRLRQRWALRAAARVRTAGGDVVRSQRAFRLNGLRWHHMAISRDLARFAAHARAVDCGEVSAERLAELDSIFGFFCDQIWSTYNRLERDVLFPWIVEGGRGARGEGDVLRAIAAFDAERDRIDDAAAGLRGRLGRLATKSRVRGKVMRSPAVCSVEMRRIAEEAEVLLEDAGALHKTEEDVLFPYISRQFTKDDQRKITFRIIDMMDKPLAKLNLVSFHEALKTTAATRADWRAYEREVPTPVRLYLWVWRGRLWEPSPLAKLDPSVTNSKKSAEMASDDGSDDPSKKKRRRRRKDQPSCNDRPPQDAQAPHDASRTAVTATAQPGAAQ